MKKHEIIATIGIASHEDKIISDMIDAGMTMARLNFSWDSHDVMSERIKQIRKIAQDKGVSIPIIQDLSGPRVQTGANHHFNEGAPEALTMKDIEDVLFGVKEGCEYVALSYVGSKDTVLALRKLIQENGGSALIISKIERQQALDNLEEIVDASDAVMVARGDLGEAVPYEEVPFIQHKIINLCNEKQKPVIVATQMLLSMTESDTPTRAEVSDVAYAIVDGATAVMLSEETAKGKHPQLAVAAMRRITICAEKHLKY
jgi:pyruvate kinase